MSAVTACPRGSYRVKDQQQNPGTTEFTELAGRGHGLVVDHGWREVADKALHFIQRHLPPTAPPAGTTQG